MRKPKRETDSQKTKAQRRPRGALGVLEVADLVGVHPQTVRRWIKQGDMVATGGGAVPYYVTQENVDAFLLRWEVR